MSMDLRKLGLSDDDLEALGYRVSKQGSGASSPGPGPGAYQPRATTGSDGATRRWFWTLAILVGVGWVASSHQRLPSPVPANRADTVFSSARAMSQLVDVARAPRPTGSPEHDRVRAHVGNRLRALGLEVEEQTTTAVAVNSGVARAATVRNVLARLPGTASTGTVALTAHYDGAPISHAAADDGMGIASILETLRAVLGGGPLRNDLVIVVTDAEELGSLGARAFLHGHPWSSEIVLALSVDMHGLSGPSLLLEDEADNGALVRTFGQVVRRSAASSTTRALLPGIPGGTLLAGFRDRGIPGLGLTAFGGRGSHHQATDRPENVDERTLQHHGVQLLSLVRAFGEADLTAASALRGPPRVYFSLPILGLVHYPAEWSVFLTLGLVVGFGLLVLLFRARGGSPRRALAGAALGVGIVAASAAAGWGLLEFLGTVHPEYGRLDGPVYEEDIHGIALLAMVLALATGAYAIARLWLDRSEIVLGALLIPVCLAVAMSFTASFALAALHLPLALALVAAVPLIVLSPSRALGPWTRIGCLALAAMILLVVVPGIEGILAVMTLEAAPLLAATIGAGALLLLPIFEWASGPKAWWTPALAATVAAAAIVLGSPGAKDDARHPVPTSLIHLVDDRIDGMTVASAWGAGEAAVLAVGANGEAGPIGGDPHVGSAMRDGSAGPAQRAAELRWMPGRWLTVPGVGEEWAMSWVVDAEGRGDDPGRLLLAGEDRWRVAGVGAEARLGRPAVRLVDTVVDGGRRRLRLAIQPGLGGEMMGVHLPDGVPAELTEVNDRILGGPARSTPIRTLTHWGRPESGAVTVGFSVDTATTTLEFDLIEHHLRPGEILGDNFFEREDSVIADASTGSDRVIQRVRVRLPLS